MKIWVLATVSVLVLNTVSFSSADDVVGRAEFTTFSDNGGPSGSIDLREENGQILGQGFSLGTGNGTINLTRTANGVKGYSLDGFFDINCGADTCTDQGSADVNLALERTASGFNLDGVLNFVNVHVSVTATDITVDADSSFQLTVNDDGSFSGQGATSLGDFLNSYTAQLTSSGTLQGVKDPAVFIATFLNASVR